MSTPEQYSAKITAKKWLTNDVFFISLELNQPMQFKAGQFVMIDLPQPGQRPRPFSMASAPEPDGSRTIDLCMKRYETSVTVPWLDGLPLDASITLKGPFGFFTLRDSPRPAYFVATGVGIAPILGMLRDEQNNKTNRDMRLLFGMRLETDRFWGSELTACVSDCTITLSQPSETWEGACGRVTEHLKTLENPEQFDFYICGHPEMVKDVQALLKSRGVPQEQLFFEVF